MITSYTRGSELISQERDGVKSYYLYDGFDSVRMLADEEGTVTDTYTYDAFGNLLSSTGETENSFLYRGEQFDSFTGLYYLRARYMNPSTGTFITMDEYAGSIFEPVSLHKYLYANANPVMNSDPSGYFTITEFSVATSISETLDSIYMASATGTLNGMFNALVAHLTGGTQEQVQAAFNEGFLNGFMMGGGYAALSKLAGCIPLLKILVSAYDGFLAFRDFQAANEYWKEGRFFLSIYCAVSGFAGLFNAAKTLMQACFTGETLVAAEEGQKRIDEIEVGDKVWAYNVETGETELKTVTTVYVHEVDEILHLYTNEGNIDTTANHPFYVVDKGWVAAADLREGDEVYNLDGSTAVVTGSELEKLDEPILIYNLEVEDFHTYFVGYEPVLVHNMCSPDIPLEDGLGIYSKQGGHHPMAKKAFEGVEGYDLYDAISISNEKLASFDVKHATITGNQKSLYTAYAKTGKPLTMDAMRNIEIEAMTKSGVPLEYAINAVDAAVTQLKSSGITQPVIIPWNGGRFV